MVGWKVKIDMFSPLPPCLNSRDQHSSATALFPRRHNARVYVTGVGFTLCTLDIKSGLHGVR